MADLAVIMSIYQNDKFQFVKQSVQSILDQTFNHFDFYIVFDGPVPIEIDNYIASLIDARVRTFRLDKQSGLAYASNYILSVILKNPRYKVIARMDADDISNLQRFKIQYEFLNSNPDISCVGSWYHEIDESGKVISNQELPVKHDEIKEFFLRRSPFAHSSVMFRRELIEIAGFYPTNTVRLEDYILWGNALARQLKFSNIPDYLLKFRVDKEFYKRRSGIKYGFRFIIARFKGFKQLKAPASAYLFTLVVGIVRMMPSFVVKSIYLRFRS